MCTKVILTVRVTSNKILVYGYISLNREGEREMNVERLSTAN